MPGIVGNLDHYHVMPSSLAIAKAGGNQWQTSDLGPPDNVSRLLLDRQRFGPLSPQVAASRNPPALS